MRIFLLSMIIGLAPFIVNAQEDESPGVDEIYDLFEAGEFKRAEFMIDSLASEYPDQLEYEILKVAYLYRTGNRSIARDSIKSIMERHPESADARLSYADLLIYESRYEEAEELLNGTYELCGDDTSCLIALRLYLANAKIYTFDYDAAIDLLKENLKLNKDDYNANAKLNYAYLAKNEFGKSIKYAVKALESNYDIALENNIAFAYTMTGKYKKALELYEKLIGEQPNQYYLLSNLGFVYTQTGNFDEGIYLLDRSLKLYPYNSFAYRHLGVAYLSVDKPGTACNYFEKALELGFTEENGDEVEKLIKKHCN